MSYDDALGFIKKAAAYGSRLGLERVGRLCSLAGNPQDALKTIHVAGTNGKGSTSAMLASILAAAGYRTGLYTSPYILDVRECMSINARQISEEEFAGVAAQVGQYAARMEREGEPPTEFEVETVMAFLWFLQSGCDFAVIETGLGGRLDATNVIKTPLASVITSVALDHTALLGDTVEKIAAEKCGIIKPGGIAVSYPLQPPGAAGVIRQRAAEAGSLLFSPDTSDVEVLRSGLDGTDVCLRGLETHISLVGAHQVWNAATAVQTVRALRATKALALPNADIAEGVRRAVMPLRQEVVCRRPVVLMDGAHNPDGLAALADTMRRLLKGRRIAAVMGMLADKDIVGSVALIAPLCDKFIAVAPQSPRALSAVALAEQARRHCAGVMALDDYREALSEAIRYAGPEGAVVVCGSLYLAGPMRKVYDTDRDYFEQLI